jgi:hypothetical protein
MLCVNSYTQKYIDEWRAKLSAQLSTHKNLLRRPVVPDRSANQDICGSHLLPLLHSRSGYACVQERPTARKWLTNGPSDRLATSSVEAKIDLAKSQLDSGD